MAIPNSPILTIYRERQHLKCTLLSINITIRRHFMSEALLIILTVAGVAVLVYFLNKARNKSRAKLNPLHPEDLPPGDRSSGGRK